MVRREGVVAVGLNDDCPLIDNIDGGTWGERRGRHAVRIKDTVDLKAIERERLAGVRIRDEALQGAREYGILSDLARAGACDLGGVVNHQRQRAVGGSLARVGGERQVANDVGGSQQIKWIAIITRGRGECEGTEGRDD